MLVPERFDYVQVGSVDSIGQVGLAWILSRPVRRAPPESVGLNWTYRTAWGDFIMFLYVFSLAGPFSKQCGGKTRNAYGIGIE